MSSKEQAGYFSDIEFRIIKEQIERRKTYRQEFLKKRTDPCMHSKEAGYVFDPAMMKFLALKTTHFEHFRANCTTIMQGLCTIVIPMAIYGAVIWNWRTNREQDIRTGKLRYRERMFKLQ